MMWKLIFLGLIIWFAILFLKRVMNQSSSSHQNKSSNRSPSDESGSETEDMVQCATCAVHLPRSEAFMINGSFYCSKAHIKK
ncbi:MAG: PP0621 family protein [Pseudomonadota bacterium]